MPGYNFSKLKKNLDNKNTCRKIVFGYVNIFKYDFFTGRISSVGVGPVTLPIVAVLVESQKKGKTQLRLEYNLEYISIISFQQFSLC